MATGLREAHGWSAERIGRYLARFPGAAGVWTPTSIENLALEPRHHLTPTGHG